MKATSKKETNEQERIAERQIALMKKGIGTLQGWKFNRDELYTRNTSSKKK
ncbi:MAG TPA: hypothetical protein VJK51_00480 [Candidatus Nanoarchaeia archaeon]|nr:hypothetical protein [Candidatus Nanoarchaeia archaeon]